MHGVWLTGWASTPRGPWSTTSATGGPRARGRAKALNAAGVFALRQGDYGPAVAFLTESRALMRALGDHEGTARTLNNLGLVALVQSDYPRAQTFFEESVALARALGDQPGMALILANLGFALRCQERFAAESTASAQSPGTR